MQEKECVKVVVRCRPLNTKERTEGHGVIVDVVEKDGAVHLRHPTDSGTAAKTFTFDHAFASDCKQGDVYAKTALPIVDAILNGYNGTIFAYGGFLDLV